MGNLLLTAVVALGAGVVATPIAALVARRVGAVDHPGPLKPQASAVPYLGGVAVMVALGAGLAGGRAVAAVPLVAAVVLGTLDDLVGMPIVVRVLGQASIGVGIALAIPWRLSGAAGMIVGGLVAVVLMNGVNLLDGLDALSGGVMAVGCAFVAILLHGPGRSLAVALACGLAAFLVFNRPPARIYLGDGGTYLLGASATMLLAYAWAPALSAATGIATLAVVAIPCAEVALAVVRRVRMHAPMTEGDRRHPYDLLAARGWPVGAVALAYAAGEAAVGAVAVAAAKAGDDWAVAALVAIATLLLVLGSATGAMSPRVGAGV